MKIGILTQPLHTNYGGLLQAFALQKVLKKEFQANPTTVNIRMNITLKSKLIGFIKNSIRKYVLFQKNVVLFPFRPDEQQKSIVGKNSNEFINNYITVTNKIGRTDIKSLKKLNFDAYIVGSDQVWRPKYSPNIFTYYLDFLKNNESVKKLSYAASFGVDQWEYKPKETTRCAALAKQFTAISVREDAAVDLCRQHLGVNAVKVLDPTLLLEKEEYLKLIDKASISEKDEDFIMFYVLDPKLLKGTIVEEVKKRLGLELNKIMPLAFTKENIKNINDCVYPPVANWLQGFYKAKYVVTDSFHGTAFSILFNKQFIALGNKERGMSRFLSILRIFGLEDRLVTNIDQIENGILNRKIEYDAINKILVKERKDSIQFLKKALFH